MLAFKKEWIEPILAGEKTMTLRANRPRFEPGRVIAATCWRSRPPFAYLEVESIDLVAKRRISDETARADGFGSARELRSALGEQYPGVEWFWLVRFRSLGPERLAAI